MKLVRPKPKIHNPEGNKTKFFNPSVYADSELHIDVADFTENQIVALKEQLTFNNPAYAAAKRYSRGYVTAIPQYLQYYRFEHGELHVPIGTNLDVLELQVPPADSRKVVYAENVPKFVFKLRQAQLEAANCFFDANRGSQPNGVVQLPTGKGKTVLALYIASRLQVKTLVIVHKDDLLKGWERDYEKAFFGKAPKMGIIKASKRKVGEFVTVATIQTLSRMDEEELSSFVDKFGLVVVDEAHHVPAATYSIVGKFNSRYKLALTATPKRKDGLSFVLNLYFGDFCFKYDPSNYADEKDILPVTVIAKRLYYKIDPLCVKVNGRWGIIDLRCNPYEYHLKEGEQFLSDIPYAQAPKIKWAEYSDMIIRMSKKEMCEDIIREYCLGHSCLVFLPQKEHVEVFEDYLKRNDRVNPADVITYYGNNSNAQNEYNLQYVEGHRQLITIATYSKATEGTNARQWEVCFLCGSLNDGKNAEQAVGRVRRTMPDPSRKLKMALVYDYSYPYAYSIRSHWRTRERRYKELQFNIVDTEKDVDKVGRPTKRKLITRGFHR